MPSAVYLLAAAAIVAVGAGLVAVATHIITTHATSRSAEHRQRRDVLAAERRWRENNARAKRAGCRCGRPATRVVEDHGTLGSVPHQTWTCDEHEGVASWSGVGRGDDIEWTPLWSHPRPCPLGDVRGTLSSIDEPPYAWHCPHRTHEMETA